MAELEEPVRVLLPGGAEGADDGADAGEPLLDGGSDGLAGGGGGGAERLRRGEEHDADRLGGPGGILDGPPQRGVEFPPERGEEILLPRHGRGEGLPPNAVGEPLEGLVPGAWISEHPEGRPRGRVAEHLARRQERVPLRESVRASRRQEEETQYQRRPPCPHPPIIPETGGDVPHFVTFLWISPLADPCGFSRAVRGSGARLSTGRVE